MQDFINHAAIERAAAETFSGPRARYALLAFVALIAATAAGLALAAIWLGLALLVEETRKALLARAPDLSPAQANAAHLALDMVSGASLAAAPAIAWYSGGALGPAVACGLFCLLVLHTALSARRGRIHALASCAPYALLGAAFLVILSELLWANAPELYMVILGALLVAFVLFLPEGLWGRIQKLRRRRPA